MGDAKSGSIILESYPNYLRVQGLDENDVSFTGQFDVPLNENSKNILINNDRTPLIEGNVEIGDVVVITFNGRILETWPVQIDGVISIKLLD
jgi:hypothetical protein